MERRSGAEDVASDGPDASGSQTRSPAPEEEQRSAEYSGWMIGILEDVFDGLQRELREKIYPRAMAIQDKTEEMQAEVAAAKDQFQEEVSAFEAEVANINDRVREIQRHIRSFLNPSRRLGPPPEKSPRSPETPVEANPQDRAFTDDDSMNDA